MTEGESARAPVAEQARQSIKRLATRALAVAVPVVAVVLGSRWGAPAAVLWLAFSALGLAAVLFSEALRTGLDAEARFDDDKPSRAARGWIAPDMIGRKNAAIRALKDLEFEHSLGRLDDADYEALSARYREEARAALRAIDEATRLALGGHISAAESLIANTLGESASGASALPPQHGDAAQSDLAREDARRERPPNDSRKQKARKRGRSPARQGLEEPTQGPPDAASCANPTCGAVLEQDAETCAACGTTVAETK